MGQRELVVLGTASQVPTRRRNHNGYVLRWDGETILFDPGEGTQRQLLLAGVGAAGIGRICLTHLHGDHTLGLPGVLARRALDRAAEPAVLHYPAASREHVLVLLRAGAPAGAAQVVDGGLEVAVQGASAGPGAPPGDPDRADGGWALAATGPGEPPAWRLVARPLDHRVPALGYRLEERDGRRMLPDRLAGLGLRGPDVGRLARAGRLDVPGPDGTARTVLLDEVSVPRRGQAFAFVMDTRPCRAAVELARGVDLLVCESTFLHADADLARAYGHMTARQAGELAAQAGARRLVLTHFSQRYGDDGSLFEAEARAAFDGEVVAADDLDRIDVPRRADPDGAVGAPPAGRPHAGGPQAGGPPATS